MAQNKPFAGMISAQRDSQVAQYSDSQSPLEAKMQRYLLNKTLTLQNTIAKVVQLLGYEARRGLYHPQELQGALYFSNSPIKEFQMEDFPQKVGTIGFF